MTARQTILDHASKVGSFKLRELVIPYDEAKAECGLLVAKGVLLTLYCGRDKECRYALANQSPFVQLDVTAAVRKHAIIKLEAECWTCRQTIRSCG